MKVELRLTKVDIKLLLAALEEYEFPPAESDDLLDRLRAAVEYIEIAPRKKYPWKEHLKEAQALYAQCDGLEIRWSSLNEARKTLIKKRAALMGWDAYDAAAFWQSVRTRMLPFDAAYVENWTGGRTLDTFLRTPTATRTRDHLEEYPAWRNRAKGGNPWETANAASCATEGCDGVAGFQTKHGRVCFECLKEGLKGA